MPPYFYPWAVNFYKIVKYTSYSGAFYDYVLPPVQGNCRWEARYDDPVNTFSLWIVYDGMPGGGGGPPDGGGSGGGGGGYP